MIECFKYLRGIYNVSGDILPRDLHSHTRGHSYKLKKPTAQRTVRQNFFSVRVVNAWNSLPETVVTAPSLNAFKNRIDKTWARYKFTLDSAWFSALKPARTNPVPFLCEKDEEEDTSKDCSDRLIGV